MQSLAVHRLGPGIGTLNIGRPRGFDRTLGEWRQRRGHCGLRERALIVAVNEFAMDDVVSTAHDEHGRPIASGQKDYAENNNL
ncbi:hypothetical protein IVB27_32020 [Bradyrhizobium sp. 197]|nr:hypothetical protein [Bradyrhizobium sp. 197]